MQFHICQANLNEGGLVRVEDVTKWFWHGLEDAGHNVSISVTTASPNGINIFYENFPNNSFPLLEELNKRGIPWGIICTERILDGSFNNFRESSVGPNFTWLQRYQNFERAARLADFIWCLDPVSYDYCKAHINPNTLLIRAGYTQGLADLTPRSESEKDVDFLFFGNMTDYRKGVIEKIRALGHEVVCSEKFLPTYLRNDMVERAKINLSILMNEDWLIPSLSRLSFLISNGCSVICERVPNEPEIETYAITVNPEDYASECVKLLESGNYVDIARQHTERYKKEMPMKEIMWDVCMKTRAFLLAKQL